MKPICLADVQDEWVIDEKDRYGIVVAPGTHLLVRVPTVYGYPNCNFRHPNIAASHPAVLEFKHYRQGGSKFWTATIGTDHFLVIPKADITLLPEKGYSYVKAEINDVPVTFNVSGGSGSPSGWQDWIGKHTTICIPKRIDMIRKIAESAVRGHPLEQDIKPVKDETLQRYKSILAAKIIPAKLIPNQSQIWLAGRNSVGTVTDIGYGRKMHWSKPDEKGCRHGESKETKRMTRLVAEFRYGNEYEDSGRYRVKPTQVDWLKTAQENDWPVMIDN